MCVDSCVHAKDLIGMIACSSKIFVGMNACSYKDLHGMNAYSICDSILLYTGRHIIREIRHIVIIIWPFFYCVDGFPHLIGFDSPVYVLIVCDYVIRTLYLSLFYFVLTFHLYLMSNQIHHILNCQ